ncbi:MAG: hypothetical protein QHH15_00240 [Candidatus Thermoplasmatota archaeon]|nr:hypothetical protein [Candidatus Thermoplasmatota archaeon]
MAFVLKHAFTSAKSDGADPTLIQPSNWNADHTPSGTGKLTMRPSLVAGKIGAVGKPTPVEIGVHAGYSMPVYSNDDEELFFREYIAGRWDGASNITVSVIVVLAGAEDVGDKFKFQLSWENKATSSGVITTDATDVEVETTILEGRAAQYSIYKVDFAIDWDLNDPDVVASDHLGLRLRRIAASSLECSGEIVVLDCVITYDVNKIFKSS